MLRPFLGPRSSSAERLKQFCISHRVDCGSGWSSLQAPWWIVLVSGPHRRSVPFPRAPTGCSSSQPLSESSIGAPRVEIAPMSDYSLLRHVPLATPPGCMRT
eukprot:12548871-Alexandrium_andersonii.AAC.1